jgi:hypothetical protein
MEIKPDLSLSGKGPLRASENRSAEEDIRTYERERETVGAVEKLRNEEPHNSSLHIALLSD